MEINILYTSDKDEHRKTATMVRKAVKNLGISARIFEIESEYSFPRVVVNGFDLVGAEMPRNGPPRLSYDMIVRGLEQTAW